MLASETERRSAVIIEGLEELAKSGEADESKVEEIRVEVHGLKGAALVVGQSRLAELATRIEVILTAQIGPGTVDRELAEVLIGSTAALREGAKAAAEGAAEPPAVGEALDSLEA